MYLYFWNPCQSRGFAAVEIAEWGGFLAGSKEQRERFEQWHPRGRAGGGKQRHGLCKPRGKPRLRAWEQAEEGGHQVRTGKEMERLNFWCGHEKVLGEGHVGCEEVRVGEVRFPLCLLPHRNQKTWLLARDGDAHPGELLLSHASCQKYTGLLARGMPKTTNSKFFISVGISRTKGAN